MRLLGIIGGIGPESTVDYYQTIVGLYRERKPDGSYPELVINSVDMQRLRNAFEANDRVAIVDYLVPELHRLHRAGAHFGLLAANTPHLVFDELQRQFADSVDQHRCGDVRGSKGARDEASGAFRHAVHDDGADVSERFLQGRNRRC